MIQYSFPIKNYENGKIDNDQNDDTILFIT